MGALLVVMFFFALFLLYLFFKTAVVVPQQNAYVVERLGKFAGVLEAGFHILVPFVTVIRYRHLLKEQAIDIPEQVCITRDNVQVGIDGILYLKIMDPERASYGISNYSFAITQLAQTTLRSEVGKIELDRTFEERTNINIQVVTEVDKASEAWGVKVLRYEVKNLTPPESILRAMQQQITAEREKRALIAKSEGEKQQQINVADGARQAAILNSEGEKQAAINRAQGEATALRVVAEAIGHEGGLQAANLKVAELYIQAFANLAKTGNTLIVPSNLADPASFIATAMSVIQSRVGTQPPRPPAPRT